MGDRLQDRMDLYNQGLSDTEIARMQNVDRSAVCMWRNARGLPTNSMAGTEAKAMLSKGRKFLYDLGWGDNGIAWQQRVTKTTVRRWRRTHALAANRPPVRTFKKDKVHQLQALQRRVVRAIGTRLPFDIAADAAADLMLAVVEGTVPISQIEKQARTFGNRALDQYANGFRQSSLDEDIQNAEGLRKIDMLVDGASSAWLEKMGATRH